MLSSPSIFFVIPAYGESPFLEDCVKSLLSQTIPVNIVIATSTPNAIIRAIAEKFQLPLIENQLRVSIADDWTCALSAEKRAKLVVLAHQDDLYMKSYAEEVITFYDNNEDVGIMFTDSYELIGSKLTRFNKRELVKKLLRIIAFCRVDKINTKMRYRFLLGFGCPIPCPSVVFSRRVCEFLNFDNQFTVNLDWAAWTKLACLKFSIGYIRKPLIIHRIHDKAQTQAAIKDSSRSREDSLMFCQYWPKSIATILSLIYKLGYK
jgi:glycosyltransferase involved in cell wall biosynthesis